MPFFNQYSTAALSRQEIVAQQKGCKKEETSRGPSLLLDTQMMQNQLPSASQPQVEPFPLKGLCSNRGSNRDSSHGQESASCLPRDDSDLAQGLTGSSQPQPFLPSFPLRPQPSFPLQPQPSFLFPPKMPLPFCPQKSSKSMIQQQFIGFHLLFLSYPIVCEKKEMVLTSHRGQGSFF